MMIDISNNSPIAIYPASKEYKITTTTIQDNIKSSWIEIDLHYGTHIDSPSHFIENGKTMLDFPDYLVEHDCQIITVPSGHVTKEFIENIEIVSSVLFFRLDNKSLNEKFDEDYFAISLSGAKYLSKMNIDIIGVNYLSVEPFNSNGDVHREILKNSWVIESLDIPDNIGDGLYRYICSPLKINAEASPIRIMID